MKKIGRFFGQIIVMILVVTTYLSLIALTFLNSAQNFVSSDNIVKMAKKLDFKELVGDTVQKEIYNTLEQAGIPTEYVDYILEDETLKEYMGNYMANGIEYILYDKELPVISEDELSNVLLDGFNSVIEQTEAYNIDVSKYLSTEEQEEVRKTIEEYTPKIIEKIPEVETLLEDKLAGNEELNSGKEKLEELRKLMDTVQKIYKWKPILIIAILLQLALMIAIKFKKCRFMKYLMMPFVLTSTFFFILSKALPVLIQKYMPSEIEKIKPILDEFVSSFCQYWQNSAILYLGIAGGILLVKLILIKIRRYQKKKQEENIQVS